MRFKKTKAICLFKFKLTRMFNPFKPGFPTGRLIMSTFGWAGYSSLPTASFLKKYQNEENKFYPPPFLEMDGNAIGINCTLLQFCYGTMPDVL